MVKTIMTYDIIHYIKNIFLDYIDILGIRPTNVSPADNIVTVYILGAQGTVGMKLTVTLPRCLIVG
jgi:hypothetical protein